MTSMHAPWLELAAIIPFVGSCWMRGIRDPGIARRYSLIFCGLTLLCALAAWTDFTFSTGAEAHDGWDLIAWCWGTPLLVIDSLSVPLLPLAALLYLLTVLATVRTEVRRFSFAGVLMSESILMATFSAKAPWLVVGLLIVGTIPPLAELRINRRPLRVYLAHMLLFVALLIAGQSLLTFGGQSQTELLGVALLAAAVLVRSGAVPVHCWLTDYFEHASFGSSLLLVTPMVGAYAATRLVLPMAPDSVLHAVAIVALVTSLYAAGMALVQREARRFFCYLFISHSSLVLIGLAVATPMGMTGAPCVWLSVGVTMTGFGLTLRSVEARTGRLSLSEFHGLYEHAPALAALFLLTGLSSIGFPGTAGFVGAEMLVEGAMQVSPLVGVAVAITGALNGLAVLQAYFRVFAGARHGATIDLRIRMPERIAVLVLTALILGAGLYPQPGVTSAYRAAEEFVGQRTAFLVQRDQSRMVRAKTPPLTRTSVISEGQSTGLGGQPPF